MPGPIEATGVVRNPTKYGALTMGSRQFTGLFTQRSPLRDGAVPYLVSKFYSGSRFDTIIDGINREITTALTDRRSPGSLVYNGQDFPAAISFASWKYNQMGEEVVRVLMDGADQTIYDATAGQKSTVFTKSVATPARFLGVNTSMYVGDGFDQKKILQSSRTWGVAGGVRRNVGDFIVDENGNIQSIQANPVTYQINAIEIRNDPDFGNFLIVSLTTPAPVIPVNRTASFNGIGTYVALNGQTLLWQGLPQSTLSLLNLTPNQIAFRTNDAIYGPAADTGNMIALTAVSGVSGLVEPIWSTVWGTITNDGGFNGGVNWTCFGPAVQNWGIDPVPSASPSYSGDFPSVSSAPLGPGTGTVRLWTPNTLVHVNYAIIDSNRNIQFMTFAGTVPTGGQLPQWATQIGQITKDGSAVWLNVGPIGTWYAGESYGGSAGGVANPCVILDSNGNLQVVSDVTTANVSGATEPVWSTTIGGATPGDGSVNWFCLGPGSIVWSGVYQYAWSPVGIDGTVGTASPVTLVANGGLSVNAGFQLLLDVDITGTSAQTDKQVSQIALWRTAQGQATLILLDYIPNPWLKGNTTVSYYDVSSDLQLNAQVPAPIASSANPPPLGFLPCCFAQGRIWGIVGNSVVYSAGPTAVTGNGNTQFPPLNTIPHIGRPYAVFGTTLQNGVGNGAQIVFTSSGIWIILGDGLSVPFASTSYFPSVNITGYNAVTLFNQSFFVVESNLKVSQIAIEYPFNPSSGYLEIGLPIGDQFKKVTTGGISASLYSSSTAFVSWNNQSTGENALYVADGNVGWFRMAPVSPPESGLCWNPRRAIVGGTSAVQAIETAPGVTQLLIGPVTSGPILARDDSGTVWDDNGTPYPSYDAKGANLLCSTGQWADLGHVSAKSMPVGARPTISVLLNEIKPSTKRPYKVLNLDDKHNDPAETPASESMYSDRYVTAQGGQGYTGDCIITKFDYGTQAEPDELIDWGIFASLHEEREETAAPTR